MTAGNFTNSWYTSQGLRLYTYFNIHVYKKFKQTYRHTLSHRDTGNSIADTGLGYYFYFYFLLNVFQIFYFLFSLQITIVFYILTVEYFSCIINKLHCIKPFTEYSDYYRPFRCRRKSCSVAVNANMSNKLFRQVFEYFFSITRNLHSIKK